MLTTYELSRGAIWALALIRQSDQESCTAGSFKIASKWGQKGLRGWGRPSQGSPEESLGFSQLGLGFRV